MDAYSITKIYAHVYVESAIKTSGTFVQKEESGEITQNFLAMSGGGDLYCDSDRA